MATIDNYKIKIQVEGNDQVVDLMDNLDQLQTTLNRTAAAGIAAFTALATSAVRMADDMVDLANATGISVGKIYQLSTALEASGGKFDDSGKFLQSFSRLLGQVEQGSSEAIDSLTKLGLTKNQIETLSDEQLYVAAINGLANMEDGFARTKLAMELFGKSAGSIDFKKLAEELKGVVDPEVEANLRLAADAVGSIEGAFRNLQMAALSAIAPILQNIKDFELTAQNAKTAIQVLGALIAAAFAASTVIQIAKVVKLMRDLGNVTKAAAAAQAFLVGLSGVGLIAVAASAAAATAAYVALGKAMEGAAEEKAALETDVATPTAGGGATRTIGVTPEEKALAAIKEQTRQLREKNVEANRYQRIINDTIGKSQQEANLIKLITDLERQAGNDKLAIQKQIDAELAKGQDSNQQIVIELQNQLTEVDKQLIAQKQLKTEEFNRLEIEKERTALIDYNVGKVKQMYDEAKFANEDFLKLLVIQGGLTEKQAKQRLELQNAQLDMNNKLYALDAQLTKENDLVKKRILEQEYKDVEAAELKRIELIKNRHQLEYDLTQSTIAGTVSAFQQIADSMTPYKMAQDAILSTWGKIGGAIDTFVTTGKFKFKDFAASVIADLSKIIAKALILQAIKSIFGSFGIPGLAEGGPTKAGKPYIVGEKGPELFVPKSAGTVIPNDKLNPVKEGIATGAVNAPVTNNYITNNINAVDAKSVAQLFVENRKTLLGTVKMAERELPYMA